jgi:hypothetical protein
MVRNESTARTAAGGGARHSGNRIEINLPPVQAGEPPRHLLTRSGIPPCGFEFLGAKATVKSWLLPCPACCLGWVPLMPDGTSDGYRLAAEIGCSVGCEAPAVFWWQAWRLGELLAREPAQADERAQRYARGALRRILGELPDRPTVPELRRAAFAAGRWLAAGDLPADPVARALLAAAARAGLDPIAVANKLAADLVAGCARPGRLPR